MTEVREDAQTSAGNVRLPDRCPACGYFQPWRVQFKYGEVWQNDHKLGGRGSARHLPPDGRSEESCAKCGAKEIYAAITVEDDRMIAVELLTDSPNEGDDTVILE